MISDSVEKQPRTKDNQQSHADEMHRRKADSDTEQHGQNVDDD